VSGLRPVAAPFVAAAPAGARVRTRLRVSARDAEVLEAAGTHLGSLAGRDLAARCAEGRLDAKGKAGSRAVRKRALTAESSSRWAGAITRTSEDQYRLAGQNLRAGQASLQARIRRIEARLAVPAGGKSGRTRGYATAAERHAKAIRLRSLKARLARADRRLAAGTVSVVRGGRALLRKRGNLAAAGLTEAQWRGQWESARLFLTADGEKDKAWGNETIRWNPDEGWLEIKLPAPLAHLANRPHGRYRLSCPVEFSYRGDEVAAQAAAGAVRYDISHDSARDRWYLDASWKATPVAAASLDDLWQHPVAAVDVNHGHLAVAVVAPDGNILGVPATIGLDLAGRPATARDGRLRAAVTTLIATARQHGACAVVIEDLDFAATRAEGTRAPRQPPLARQARPGLPAAGLRHPHRQVPGSAGPDGRQCRAVGDRCRSRLYLPVGGRALACPAAGASPESDRPPRGSAGDRATRTRPPGQAPRGRKPHRPGGRGTANPAWRRTPPAPRSAPRNPPPHEGPGSHAAPRPAGLTGPRQATRQPRTVRGRRLVRTISC